MSGQSRLPTEVHALGTVGIQVDVRGTRGTAVDAYVGVFGQSTMDVSRLFLPELRRGEVIATVAIAPSALGDVEAMAVAVLQGSRLSERFSGIDLSAECGKVA